MCCPDSCSLLSRTGPLIPWAVLAENSWELQAMHFSSVTVPKNNAAKSSSHSEILTVWYGRMCLNSTANNHFSTNPVDMEQPGSKTYHFQELSEGWTSAQGWKQHSCKQEDWVMIPQQQSKRTVTCQKNRVWGTLRNKQVRWTRFSVDC